MRYLITLYICLLFALPVEAMQLFSGKPPAAVSGDCPSWGTYALAWTGGHSSGNTEICTASGAGSITGTNTGGTFAGSGHDTTWISDANNDKLEWAVTSSNIDHDDSAGWTVCMRLQIASMTATTVGYEFQGGGGTANHFQNHAYGRFYSASDLAESLYEYSDTSTGSLSTGTTTDDGSTWNEVCFSWKVGEAGNDSAVSVDGGSAWDEDDDDIGAWDDPTNAEDAIRLGNSIWSSSGDEIDITYFVVMSGYKQSKPW